MLPYTGQQISPAREVELTKIICMQSDDIVIIILHINDFRNEMLNQLTAYL